MASEMFTNFLVDEEGKPLPALEETFVNNTSQKLREDTFTCLGFDVLPGIPNVIASENFKQPDETIADHKKRLSGWHNTWGKMLGGLVTAFNTPSAEILRVAPPTAPFYAIGDPTKFLTEALDPVKAEIEPIIGMSLFDYLKANLDLVFKGLKDLVAAVLLIPTGKGFKKFISYIAGLFPDSSKEIINKIKKAIKKQKDKIEEKIIAILLSLPTIPTLVLPTLENILEYLNIEIDLEIDLTLSNLRSMIYPGIPELSLPQGILLIFLKTILAFIEILTDLFTNLSSFLFSIGEILQLILQLKFLEAINSMLGKVIEYAMEKILSIVPEIIGSASFLCTLMAFLELAAKIICVSLFGHLFGPGLIFQTIAGLIMSL